MAVAAAFVLGLTSVVFLCPRHLVLMEPHPIKNCEWMTLFEAYWHPDGNRWDISTGPEPVLTYPNVEGRSQESLRRAATNLPPRIAERFMNGGYAYVPGFTTADKQDLVMLYLKQPTKLESGLSIASDWRVLIRPRMWAVLPPYIEEGHTDRPVLLNTHDFKSRLERTLQFLKDNNRPYWENVAKEHTAFLNTIKE
jgi:hypothetical protein